MRKETLESFVLGDVLRSRADSHRTEPFLRFRDGELTYGEVHTTANRLAQGLLALGVGKGDHVAVMLPNCPEFVPIVFALARIGAVAVPVNTAHRGELLRHVLFSSDSTVLIVDSSYVDRIPPVAGRLPGLGRLVVRGGEHAAALGKPAVALSSLLDHGDDEPRAGIAFSDLQAIMYTSGTTGPSKGAMCSHALALTCAYDSLNFLDRWGKTIYCPLPLFHAAGLWDGMMSALLSGGTLAVVERFSASRFWDDVRHFDAQVAMSVFSMIPILLNREPTPDDGTIHSRCSTWASRRWTSRCASASGCARWRPTPRPRPASPPAARTAQWRVGSCGTVHDERFVAAVVDEHDREVGPGEPGELVLRPRQPFVITTGYYGTPEATAETFRNLWFHTGDQVWRDEDGYFYFLDRMKDSIRRRGENISAFELECEVNLHPAVLE